MKRFLTALLAAAVTGALFVASPLIAAPKDTNFNNSEETVAQGCGDGNELAIVAPEKLWPPNHKYFEDVYARATGSDGEQITLETRGVHDQYDADGVEENGSGNTADDITVDDEDSEWVQDSDPNSSDPQVIAIETGTREVITNWAVRSERSGRDQAGRTYTLQALATFAGDTTTGTGSGSCELTVQMVVPHDMRPTRR